MKWIFCSFWIPRMNLIDQVAIETTIAKNVLFSELLVLSTTLSIFALKIVLLHVLIEIFLLTLSFCLKTDRDIKPKFRYNFFFSFLYWLLHMLIIELSILRHGNFFLLCRSFNWLFLQSMWHSFVPWTIYALRRSRCTAPPISAAAATVWIVEIAIGAASLSLQVHAIIYQYDSTAWLTNFARVGA